MIRETLQSSLPETASDWAGFTVAVLTIITVVGGAIFWAVRSVMRLIVSHLDRRIQHQMTVTVTAAVSAVLDNGITERLATIERLLMSGGASLWRPGDPDRRTPP